MMLSDKFTEITKHTGLYNIQAISNIRSIMEKGILSNEKAMGIFHKSIALNEVQARRDIVQVPGGLKLHQYANLYFDPWNPMLSRRRDQNHEVRMKVKIGNIFDSDCKAIVNTVNCVGVMGKGIALEFKKKYPEMYSDYSKKCDSGEVHPGIPYVFQNSNGVQIINFPTKDHWRSPSRLSYVVRGLDWFIENYQFYGISSVAFPPLGCGNGGLDWDTVGPLMYQKLKKLPIEVEIYAPFGVSKNKITDTFLSRNFAEGEVFGKGNPKINPKWYLILEVVRELNERKYALKVGRTIYQKICYVITRNGVNTGFIFSKGNYGPYSESVKDSITTLANANLILERTLGRMVSLSVSESFFIDQSKFSEEEWNAMKKTVDLFGRMKDTEQAEMVATVLYAYDELKGRNNLVRDIDVYDYVMSWKPHWKEEKSYMLCDAIHNLAMLSLIAIEHTDLLIDTLLI
jgi:appr-1-p processing protein